LYLQNSFDGTKVQLVTKSKDGEKFEVTPIASNDRFEIDRGMILRPEKRTREAVSFGEAIALGARETKEDVLLVYRFLQKLVSGQVSATMLRGPLTIGYVAHDRASAGFSQLLIFLAVLSANLAVVNFLPIPVLDGGHMVFLALEGLRGKPVSEGVFVAFQYAGLCFILSLMVFVLSMDVGEFWVKVFLLLAASTALPCPLCLTNSAFVSPIRRTGLWTRAMPWLAKTPLRSTRPVGRSGWCVYYPRGSSRQNSSPKRKRHCAPNTLTWMSSRSMIRSASVTSSVAK
jgi:hypothetical protein